MENNTMANIYKCENCGSEIEIEDGHKDNVKINVAGILYRGFCEMCNGD